MGVIMLTIFNIDGRSICTSPSSSRRQRYGKVGEPPCSCRLRVRVRVRFRVSFKVRFGFRVRFRFRVRVRVRFGVRVWFEGL
tara:strand:+ start:87 stop:332 length:246 start_codon:yes stop_codon:yes gene_type:complete